MVRYTRHLGLGALALLGLLGTGCPTEPEFPDRPKPVDAGTPADCKAACDRMRELKCPEGAPDDEGNTCETVCEHVEQSGTVTLDPACVTKIKICADIDRCSY